ncbi:mediator of RNA polymerase II transcription subunit 22 isoform X1 [Serinus canaria]|uniref:mediator of RNA polymerase II transcription subunit 22 isoform X1 n=1 Tax=Serinus canaria TaxID=9135 RepID=UPI0021CC811A|nr:mediator of RNA polymerase II transcription subunit 22 isoform X1 [Serinus canaria]
MAQPRVLPQSKETLLQSYNKRLKDDVKSIMDNFTEIIKTAKIEDETQVSRATQGEQDNYEMHVRAANIVRAGESLMKLVSDLKQFLILNDFPSVNEAINQRNQQLRSLQEECDKKLIALRDEISIDLYELEEEYYSSSLLETRLCHAVPREPLDASGSCHSRAERCHLAEFHPFAPARERARGGPRRAFLKRIRGSPGDGPALLEVFLLLC